MNFTHEKLSLKLLCEIAIVFKEHYGDNYNVKITEGEKNHTLCTDTFFVLYSIPDKAFYVSFRINQQGQRVAIDTKLIMLVLDHSEFSMMEDSYYDKNLEHVVFGNEAIEARQDEIIENMGKLKCPMCEKIGGKEFFVDTGVCKFCDGKKSEMVWH